MIVGIDLGTTNSLAAVWEDGRPQLIPNALNEVLTPSVVGVDDTGDILVGRPALERMLVHPELTASVFKRYMGTPKKISLGKHTFRPEELSSFVLRRLKEDAECRLGRPVEEAIISVPAYFNDTQRKATRIAGQLAGLRVDRLINEPTAAALSYGLQSASSESRFLVYDLGGGTFDVTVLELFEGVMEVRASCGDNFLGGEDFVKVLIDHFAEKAAIPAGIKTKDFESGALYQVIRREAERAKCRLSDEKSTVMEIRLNGDKIMLQISQEEFASWSDQLLTRLRTPVERALRDAKIRPSELNEILLVGGATRMPIVRNMVARMFGRFPNFSINPEEAVAEKRGVHCRRASF
jgi:molecular chaperone HscC